MEAEAQRSDAKSRGVSSCRALLGPSHSGLMVFPAPQDPLGLAVSLEAEKNKSLLCQTLGLAVGRCLCGKAQVFGVQLLSWASH